MDSSITLMFIVKFVIPVVGVILAVIAVGSIWKIAKAFESLANSTKEIAKTLNNQPK